MLFLVYSTKTVPNNIQVMSSRFFTVPSSLFQCKKFLLWISSFPFLELIELKMMLWALNYGSRSTIPLQIDHAIHFMILPYILRNHVEKDITKNNISYLLSYWFIWISVALRCLKRFFSNETTKYFASLQFRRSNWLVTPLNK